MIISVGYRVKSKNGVIFRKWATNNNGINILDHFVDVDKMVSIGSNAQMNQKDYK